MPVTLRPLHWLVILAAFACVGLVCLYVGHRIGAKQAYLHERRLAESPEVVSDKSAEWTGEKKDVPKEPQPSKPAQAAPLVAAEGAFAIDVMKPVRITFPLDIGPDVSPDRPDARVCLRARQGANELQLPGQGKAFYPFRLAKPMTLRSYFHIRWTDDMVGSADCNNSWFAGFDDRPAEVVGNEEWYTRWFWEEGPVVKLSAGVHWLRVELREDGPVMDKAVLVPSGEAADDEGWTRMKPLEFGPFAGVAPPTDPQNLVRDVEVFALPTGSLAIGRGHVNEFTVCASWQGKSGAGFSGTIDVKCPTAPGLTVEGDRELVCGPERPFCRNIVRLTFPEGASRRAHPVVVSVKDAGGAVVFRDETEFIKGYAWAFLGPFADKNAGRRNVFRGKGDLDKLDAPCDKDPLRIARMATPEELGVAGLPMARGRKLEWKVVSDGSCYDWTGAIDLIKVFGRTDSAFAYAVTWIDAETELHHRSFNFQGDDSGWCWVNGTTIAVLPVDLPKEANRLWSSAALHPGANAVVVKLTQNVHYWGFRFDVIDWHWQGRRGDVITGLDPEKWPK
jgi:hypothetical protein